MKRIWFILFFCGLVLAAKGQSIVTVAGLEDVSGSALNQLNSPGGIFRDASGNLYVTDRANHRVVKWASGATTGVVVAGGNGNGSNSNQLAYPNAVFVDGSGNIYISDASNYRVQKWASGASSGTTVAGGNGYGSAANQFLSMSDMKVDGSGNIYVSDSYNDRVQIWAPGATTGTSLASGGVGSATNQLDNPRGLWLDASDNLYVVDKDNNRVMKWAPGATSGTVFVSTLNSGTYLALDADNNIYFTTSSSVFKRIVGTSTTQTIYSGAASEGVNMFPLIGSDNTLYVSFGDDHYVGKFSPPADPTGLSATATHPSCGNTTGSIAATATAPSGATLEYSLNNSTWQSSGTFNSLTPGGYTVYVRSLKSGLTSTGTVSTSVTINAAPSVPGSPTGLTATPVQPVCGSAGSITASATAPSGATLQYSLNNSTWQSSGTFTPVATGTYSVYARAVSSSGCFSTGTVSTLVTINAAPGSRIDTVALQSGIGVAGVFVDATNNVYVPDAPNSRVLKWAPGATSGVVVAGGNGYGSSSNQLKNPVAVSVDNTGNVYVLDGGNYRVQKWAPGATTGTTVAGGNGSGSASNQFSSSVFDMKMDAAGNIYVSDAGNYRVQKWAPGATSGTTVAGGNGSGSSANKFGYPAFGICLDASGNLYVADPNNQRVQKWAPGATFGTTVLSSVGYIVGMAIDSDDNLYISGDYWIKKWSPGATAGFTMYQASSRDVYGPNLFIGPGNTLYAFFPDKNYVGKFVTPGPIAPPTALSATPTHPVCGSTGSITVSATPASGATLEYSLDNITWQSDATFTALAAGNYTIYVRSVSDSCHSEPMYVSTTLNSSGTMPTQPSISAAGSTTCGPNGIALTMTGSTGTISWYLDGNLIPGATSATHQAIATGSYTVKTSNSCGTSLASAPVSVTINLAYRSKTSRFDIFSTDLSNVTTDTTAAINEQKAAIAEQGAVSCEANADTWMRRLAPGLAGRVDSAAKSATLRLKLIELCTAGTDLNHPLGASTLAAGQTISGGYSSFGEVIKGVMGIPDYTSALNPWLLGTPYPHNVKTQLAERFIVATDSSLCAKLTELKSQRDLVNPATPLYTYLTGRFGTAMNITADELASLEQSCSNCNYILAEAIKLPVFMEPGTQGCITGADLTAAKADLNSQFDEPLATSDPNYEIILRNFLNQRWGFALSFDRYQRFQDSLVHNPGAILCGEPLFSAVEPDIYQGIKDLISLTTGSAKAAYKSYIIEEKDLFRASYISTCSAAQANAGMKAPQKDYHYTLYYYDQADNLLRTVPPAGVGRLADDEVMHVQRARNFDPDACAYNGPTSNSSLSTALTALKNKINGDITAVEVWTYNPLSTGGQVIVSADMNYMVQVCISGGNLNADIYTLNQESSGTVTITHSNHIAGSILGQSIFPWSHVVVQGANIASGTLKLYFNGKEVENTITTGQTSCDWQISTNPLTMPQDVSLLKHLRVYDRLMTPAEIATNAGNACLAASNTAGLGSDWYRFNVPAAGTFTTISESSTLETQYVQLYPNHALPTTYVYNSTNQVMKQKSPDGGINRFWYDELSRLTASQDQKQRSAGYFTYTQYDPLGRVVEMGQKIESAGSLDEPVYLDSTAVSNFLLAGSNTQLTQTFYDTAAEPLNGVPADILQENLRKRIAATIYRETQTSNEINASYYSYDLSGNVKTLYQQVNGLYNQTTGTGLKRIDYEYDLLTGKVNFVGYQHNKRDAFYYQFEYDAENRLSKAYSAVEAAVDSLGISSRLLAPFRRLDASYQYYLHGPLARIELGDDYNKLQGLDYAYTLKGWIKGVNGDKLDTLKEIGHDAAAVARDVMAYSLNYYANDYKPIGGSGALAFDMNYTAQTGDITGRGLYNGNISSGTMALSKFRGGAPIGYSYRYDQLERLKETRAHHLTGSTTGWDGSSIVDSLKESISYDGNGNILTYLRNGNGHVQPLAMDQLTYGYSYDTNGRLTSNRLKQIHDAVPGSNYIEDIDDQGDNNYQYDAIGNLISDQKEGIDQINWNMYGKIISITKHLGSEGPVCDPDTDPFCEASPDDAIAINYSYDAGGNRVAKTSNGASTWYVRDARGNALALYNNVSSNNTWIEQHLYGLRRLGIWKTEISLEVDSGKTVWADVGRKAFELSNHLGNVSAVISDQRVQNGTGYEVDVRSAQDYYPFGMMQPGRSYNSVNYRFGFNGKENDTEVKGIGNQQDYGMRIYDPRIAKFLSVDPITGNYPELTPYQFASNTPIQAIDIDGLEKYTVSDDLDKQGRIISKTIIALVNKSDVKTVVEMNLTTGNKAAYLTKYPVHRFRPLPDKKLFGGILTEEEEGMVTNGDYELRDGGENPLEYGSRIGVDQKTWPSDQYSLKIWRKTYRYKDPETTPAKNAPAMRRPSPIRVGHVDRLNELGFYTAQTPIPQGGQLGDLGIKRKLSNYAKGLRSPDNRIRTVIVSVNHTVGTVLNDTQLAQVRMYDNIAIGNMIKILSAGVGSNVRFINGGAKLTQSDSAGNGNTTITFK